MSLHVRRNFVLPLLVALALAAALRSAWLTSDPPAHATVGIVWHDEGAWVHNARNKALWGTWRTDNWNPMFIAPVFTALEYVSFEVFGVGTWQARVVPVGSGLFAVAALALGLLASVNRRAAIVGALLLATNYVFVMWNRAALMESTMTAFIAGSWAAYAASMRRPSIGLVAGACAVLAWFSKASAAFFVAALVLDACITISLAMLPPLRARLRLSAPDPMLVRAACWTLCGIGLAALAALVLFVGPRWTEYWFYNWRMSVERKPSYTIRALLDRASWLPIAHDFFTRMWLVTVAAALGVLAVVARWRNASPALRLLVLWLFLGLLELIVHDSGNERRYVMFVPALTALAAVTLASEKPLLPSEGLDRATRLLLALVLLPLAYLVIGAVTRLFYLYRIGPGVRLSAALAFAGVALVVWHWRRSITWLTNQRIVPRGAAVVVALVIAGDFAQYGQWLRHRTTKNYEASLMLGRVLAPGTLVHGKLANGLSLENRIRPVFVGRGFGNYEDRKTRDDVRYILTYVSPWLGYEGSVILDVLEAYPKRADIMTFDVAEATTSYDRAVLIDKFGGGAAPPVRMGRAHD
jgi:hypothetical protein